MNPPPPEFTVGDYVEVTSTRGVDGWGRILEAEWLEPDADDPYSYALWYYTVDGLDHWWPEPNLRRLSLLEVMAFVS